MTRFAKWSVILKSAKDECAEQDRDKPIAPDSPRRRLDIVRDRLDYTVDGTCCPHLPNPLLAAPHFGLIR